MKLGKKKVIFIWILAVLFLGLVFFLPAGTFDYWQAWVFLAVIMIPAFFVMLYFWKRDPGLLERRMNFKEKEVEQKSIIKLSFLLFLIGVLTPGFDHRLGWSHVSPVLVIISDIIIVLSYLLIFFVFKENSYTSRTVQVYKKQKVISSGPYSVIRHPMYLGVMLMYIFMPLALGSYYALIFFLPVIILIVFRTLNEEKVLRKKLKGYKEYMKKVRYKIIPYIW